MLVVITKSGIVWRGTSNLVQLSITPYHNTWHHYQVHLADPTYLQNHQIGCLNPSVCQTHQNGTRILKARVANVMLWVEHYNARVEYFKARLRRNGDPFGLGLVPLEIETLAEYLTNDIQKVHMVPLSNVDQY